MRGEGPELCLALAEKGANGARGGLTALARNGGDGEAHKLARKVGQAEQIVFDRQRKILARYGQPQFAKTGHAV